MSNLFFGISGAAPGPEMSSKNCLLFSLAGKIEQHKEHYKQQKESHCQTPYALAAFFMACNAWLATLPFGCVP